MKKNSRKKIKMILAGKKAVRHIAEDLVLNRNMVDVWVKQYREKPFVAFPGKGHQASLEE